MFNSLVYKNGDEIVTQLFFGQDSCERAGKIITTFGDKNTILTPSGQAADYMCYSHGSGYEISEFMFLGLIVILLLNLLSDVLYHFYKK